MRSSRSFASPGFVDLATRPRNEHADCVIKIETLHQHHEPDRVTARPTAEALERSGRLANHERRLLLEMKWSLAGEVPTQRLQLHVPPNHLRDRNGRRDGHQFVVAGHNTSLSDIAHPADSTRGE